MEDPSDTTTSVAIEHQFRPLKKKAQAMQAGTASTRFFPFAFSSRVLFDFAAFLAVENFNPLRPPFPTVLPVITVKHFKETFANYFTAIAREYGDSVTGKAVSTYFERVKKDPNWQRTDSIPTGENGTPKKTPVKRGPRAKKATPAKKMGSSDDNEDDDEEMDLNGTPTKGPLNKVKNGRVAKSSPRSTTKKSYKEDSSEIEEGEENERGERVKQEPTPTSMSGNDVANGASFESYTGSFAGNGQSWYEAEEAMADEDEEV